MKARLNKIMGPFIFLLFKRRRLPGAQGPVAATNSGFKKESVIKKLKLIPQVHIQIQGKSIPNFSFLLIYIPFKRMQGIHRGVHPFPPKMLIPQGRRQYTCMPRVV